MNICYIYPRAIYMENENDLQFIKNTFNQDERVKNINIGEWFFTREEKFYIVRPLDTFESVAKKLDITVEALKKICKTKHLFIGQKISF